MYENANPAVRGRLDCWRFNNDETEAEAVAQSCQRLCAAGMNPRDIMILLSSRRPARRLHEALEAADVPFAPVREKDITDTDAGRAAYAMLAIVADPENYGSPGMIVGEVIRARVRVGG